MKVTSRTNLTALYEYLYSTTKKNEQHPKDEKEDEELRKAAWRALRRAKRIAAERQNPRERHSRWEVQS